MCGENKACVFILLLGLLSACIAGALRGEEPGPWYLIPEAELRSIEQYRETSERERRSWLLQVRALRTQAGRLEADSESLSRQLAQAREAQRRLEQSYSGSEAEWSAELSSLNGELADKALEAERHKRAAGERLIAVIALAGAWALYIAVKVSRIFRPP